MLVQPGTAKAVVAAGVIIALCLLVLNGRRKRGRAVTALNATLVYYMFAFGFGGIYYSLTDFGDPSISRYVMFKAGMASAMLLHLLSLCAILVGYWLARDLHRGERVRRAARLFKPGQMPFQR